MTQSIQKIREELALHGELTELIDVLKNIAVAQYWALERKKERFDKFLNAFENFFHFIDLSAVEDPLVNPKGKLGLIMITSDEGFMGGLNMRVIESAMRVPDAAHAELIVIGERGADYLRSSGRRFTEFPGIGSDERFESALKLRDYLIDECKKGSFSRLIMFYPRPVSFTVQKVERLVMLPSSELFEKREDMIKEGEFVIVESDPKGMMRYLMEVWIGQKLLEVFEDSKLAEFSARTVHLEESYQLLLEKGKAIRYQYFRSRHELIDKGMRDLFGAQVVVKRAREKAGV